MSLRRILIALAVIGLLAIVGGLFEAGSQPAPVPSPLDLAPGMSDEQLRRASTELEIIATLGGIAVTVILPALSWLGWRFIVRPWRRRRAIKRRDLDRLSRHHAALIEAEEAEEQRERAEILDAIVAGDKACMAKLDTAKTQIEEGVERMQAEYLDALADHRREASSQIATVKDDVAELARDIRSLETRVDDAAGTLHRRFDNLLTVLAQRGLPVAAPVQEWDGATDRRRKPRAGR